MKQRHQLSFDPNLSLLNVKQAQSRARTKRAAQAKLQDMAEKHEAEDLDEIREENPKLDDKVSWFGLGTQFFLIASDIKEKDIIASSSVEHIILNNSEYYGSFVKVKGIPANTSSTINMNLYMCIHQPIQTLSYSHCKPLQQLGAITHVNTIVQNI